MKATWNDQIIAESDDTIVIEGNHYFPPEAVKTELLTKSQTQTTCPWKGQAQYYHLKINDEVIEDVAWVYPNPKAAAQKIAGHYAFEPGVKVVE